METMDKQLSDIAHGSKPGRMAVALIQRRSGGQAIVILALFLMFLLGLSGIVYDLGFARDEAAKAQRAADAAALAGVVFMPEHFNAPHTQVSATDAAQMTAARHGYSNVNNVTVLQVPLHPAQLRVDIASSYTTTFMNIFGFSTIPIHVSATAEYNHPITMGAPEPYLGVGSPTAQQRSGDPSMRMQGFWLSLHSPGSPKENGDPFLAKWDYTTNGCNGCFPIGGQFQPDHDLNGYSFGLYVGNGDSPYLQIYDPGYQPKPGFTSNGNGVMNRTFSHDTPCGDPSIHYPTACPGGQPDFNNPSGTTWCASNNVETGDNELGYGQCDPQAAGATAVYTLYYPDSTPWYFDDDTVAATWSVPANHLPDASHIQGNIDSTHMYSQTWVNYGNVANPGYQLFVYGGNHQWRMEVNVPLDNNSNSQGVGAQNNFGIRLVGHSTETLVYAIQRLPVLATVNAGISDFFLANVGIENASKTLVVSMFDPGDANGTNYIQLMAPPDATSTYSHPVNVDIYAHDNRHNPPGADLVYLNQPSINTTRPTYNYNDEWIDVLYRIPDPSVFRGGYFAIRYNYTQQTQDRTAWRISIRGNPVHLVLGGN